MAPHQPQHAGEDQHAPTRREQDSNASGTADVGRQRERQPRSAVLERSIGSRLSPDVESRLAARVLAQHPADARTRTRGRARRIAVHVVDVSGGGGAVAAAHANALFAAPCVPNTRYSSRRLPVRLVGATAPTAGDSRGDRHARWRWRARRRRPRPRAKNHGRIPWHEDRGGGKGRANIRAFVQTRGRLLIAGGVGHGG